MISFFIAVILLTFLWKEKKNHKSSFTPSKKWENQKMHSTNSMKEEDCLLSQFPWGQNKSSDTVFIKFKWISQIVYTDKWIVYCCDVLYPSKSNPISM